MQQATQTKLRTHAWSQVFVPSTLKPLVSWKNTYALTKQYNQTGNNLVVMLDIRSEVCNIQDVKKAHLNQASYASQ